MAEGVCKHGAEDENQPKREEETDRKKMQSEGLHNFYFSQNIIMRFSSRIDGAYSMNSREWNFMRKCGSKTSRKAST